jgi:predicted MFS family arabinose efflux permease
MHKNKSVSRFQVLLMAITAGISVANIYYNQPILKEIGKTFHATESQDGLIAMLSQIGYGLGLFFITPLGDKLNKKKLILSLQTLQFITLLSFVFAMNIVQVWIVSLLLGLFSVSVQVIMPMAAGLDSKNRGRNVGTIFTGALIGILAARVFSGSIAEWIGWRYVYLISAAMVFLSILFLRVYLPDVGNPFRGNYVQLLSSALRQVKRFSLLRNVALMGALQFGFFCAFWTTLTFHLSGAPFHFRSHNIGLFGLVAIAGAMMAPLLGKKTDAGKTGTIRMLAVSLIISGIVLMMIFRVSVIALIIAVLIMDIGIQAMQVTHVALIYSLDESSHSRINTIFMTSVFIGGALGTLSGLFCWKYFGWVGVTGYMLVSAVLIMFILIKERKTNFFSQ